MRILLLLTTAAVALAAVPVAAQSSTTPTPSTRDRIGQILGNLLGVDNSADSSLDGQWRAGRLPLGSQRTEFNARVDADSRSGVITEETGARLKADYAALVDLEARYGADRLFTTNERSELSSGYNVLLQVLADRRYADSVTPSADVRDGQAEFNRRVDARVSTRRLTRTVGTRLKNDYAAVIQVEAGYLRDGTLSDGERDDLDMRLDALDARVGDVAYTAPVTAKTRLDAIARALPNSGLTATARTQLLVEHGDLIRLEAAYARLTPSTEERTYLDQRLANLETRARVIR
ncbi:hypothetical protein [uncultured Erythrobacter sp.]|uniref:hypothetical protein n=1 Tax=uncultured Erythrobacter sp. TaxID=263913 RepID=UPI002658EEBB|nr:hypothetical protein [uncultured Erythrobacter sp.]